MDYQIHFQIFQGTFYNRHLTIKIIVKVKIMDFFLNLNHILSSVYNNIPVNDLIYYIVLLYANKVNILPISNVLSKIIVSITLIKAF